MVVPENSIYVDGAWRRARDGNALESLNPATEEVLTTFAASGSPDVADAAEAARKAFDSGWGSVSGSVRAGYLRAIAARVRERSSFLSELEVRDNGKPLPEAAWDIEDTAGCFEYYASLAEQLDDTCEQDLSLPDPRFRCIVRREPVGVAGLVIPWNYPMLMAAWKVAPALAAGCTCVLKPSELTPLTALELGQIAHDVQLPRGVLNVVTGNGPDAGAPLAVHPAVDKIAFTGGLATGSRLMQAVAPDVKRISLELGGKSPIVVFADTDLDQAVEWIMFGIFWNQGQVCSATSRLLVERPLAARLVDALVSAAKQIRIGNGLDEGTQLGPLVSSQQRTRVSDHVRSAVGEGARLLTGGQAPPDRDKGWFFEPTVLDSVTPTMRIWNEEVFGPVLCVTPFDTEEEGIRLANRSRFGLGAAVMSADRGRSERVARAMRAGVVWIDCSQPTFVQAPWGGMKSSGFGRELGPWGLDGYLEVKQITAYETVQGWGWYREA